MAEAAACYVLGPFNQWPPPATSLTLRQAIGDVALSIWASPDTTLSIAANTSDGEEICVATCPIDYRGPAPFRCIVAFGDAHLDVWINGALVVSGNNKTITGITVGKATERPHQDFSHEITAARMARRKEELSRKPAKDRVRLLSVQENMDALIAARYVLADSLTLLEQGSLHFYIPLAGTLRALICRRGRRVYPLLQRAAGLLDLPLTVFSIYHADAVMGSDIPQIDLELCSDNITLEQHYPATAEIDLDMWLNLFGAQCEGKLYTNDDVIRAIADTRSAHFDPDIEPLVHRLEAMTVGLGGEHNAAIRFLMTTGKATIGLCDRTIEASQGVS